MKKRGFTLAEVLVTLGIIGVVAALTTPALIQHVGNSKIGPKLAKAKATFETASEMMLNDNNAASIRFLITEKGTDNAVKDDGSASDEENGGEWKSDVLGNMLSNYMKITRNEDEYDVYNYFGGLNKNYGSGASNNTLQSVADRYDTDEGITYWIWLMNSVGKPHDDWKLANIPHNQTIGVVYVDVNGDQKPNRMGKDVFMFRMYNDGTLRPNGANMSYLSEDPAKQKTWKDGNCDKSGVKNGDYCAGSIFENGMKIIYE